MAMFGPDLIFEPPTPTWRETVAAAFQRNQKATAPEPDVQDPGSSAWDDKRHRSLRRFQLGMTEYTALASP